MLRTRLPEDAGGDTVAQNRYTALRQFEILACEASGAIDCTQDAHFTSVLTSPADAFPSVGPRPRAPDLIMRSFAVPRTRATHVRLRVLSEPVHRRAGVPGRPGRRPHQRDRLR